MKYIVIITTITAIIYLLTSREANNQKVPKDNTTSTAKINGNSKQVKVSTEKTKDIATKKEKKKKSELDESKYNNIFAYFSDHGIPIPLEENDIMMFIQTTLKQTKDYHAFIQALLNDFSQISSEDDNYVFMGYFIALESDLVEKEIFKSLENSNEFIEKERWSALLASIELRTKEGRDKVNQLIESTKDSILKSNYISSLSNSIVKTEEEKKELSKVLSPYMYDKDSEVRAAAISRSFQWNDLMKNTKPIEDALNAKDLSVKSAALFSISQTEKVPLKLKDTVYSIMNNEDLDYTLRVNALNTLVVFKNELSDDEMSMVREFGKKFEEL